ncbi:MAG: class I SAM-dependent methyltransferase [Treponema sp.]|jgi:SAM-dependent methyltransferase|nr:class I SAM-dependent methyltransferase [Treponema sp.]
MTEDYLAGNLYSNTADYYDYDNRDIIKDDLNFYTEYAQKNSGPILELASGTGRVSLYLAENTNRPLDCVELSASMVGVFKEKTAQLGKEIQERVHIHQDDMTKINMGKKYNYIIIPWRALQWIPFEEGAIECLKKVYEHLEPGGLFIFDIFKPMNYDEKWLGHESTSYDIETGGKRIIRSTRNEFYDNEKKYIKYSSKFKIIENGKETVKEDMITIKYYLYDDMAAILKNIGFNITAEYGYYDKRSIPDGDEMIFICTR